MVRRAAIVILVSAAAVCAQESNEANSTPENLKNLSLEELSEIEVTTPSKQPSRALQTPAAIYVITGEDIRRSGATSIPEALRLAPGVEVARIDANKWSIGIRGFGSRLSRDVLVMMDGRTVYTNLFAGTYWEVQNTMMEDIDRIEVIRGPGGTIWGPNAVNGVINIITKSAHDTRGVLATAGTGDEELGFMNFRYGAGNGAGVDYRVYGMGFTRGPEEHQDGPNFDDWRSAQGGFRIDWTKSSHDSFSLQGDIYDEVAGESVSATSYAPPYSQIVNGNALLSGGNVMGKWTHTSGDGNDISIQAYYDKTNRLEPNLADYRYTFDVDYVQRRRWAWNEFTWGLGARDNPIHDVPVVSGLVFAPARRTDYLMTAFFQDEIKLPDHLSLTLGTKLLKTNFTGVDPEPSVRLMWNPTEKSAFWTAFTHALRTPSDAEENFSLLGLVELLPDGTPLFARFNPNTHFAPEQLNGYELGYRQLFTPKLYVDFASYYNHYHDLFSEDIIGSPYLETTPPLHYLLPAQFANGLYGDTKGLEIAPEWRPNERWRLRGSYSFLHMNLGRTATSQDIGTWPLIEGSSPAHQVMAESAVDLTGNLQLDLDYRYVSGLPGQYVNGFPAVFVHAYSTADARLGWRVSRHFGVELVGRNLLQPAHVEFGSDPGPLVAIQRSAFVRLTWTK